MPYLAQKTLGALIHILPDPISLTIYSNSEVTKNWQKTALPDLNELFILALYCHICALVCNVYQK